MAGKRQPLSALLERGDQNPQGPLRGLLQLSGRKTAARERAAVRGHAGIKLETEDRATGYWVARLESDPSFQTRTSGVYVRADPDDVVVLEGDDLRQRADLIARRLRDWTGIVNV